MALEPRPTTDYTQFQYPDGNTGDVMVVTHNLDMTQGTTALFHLTEDVHFVSAYCYMSAVGTVSGQMVDVVALDETGTPTSLLTTPFDLTDEDGEGVFTEGVLDQTKDVIPAGMTIASVLANARAFGGEKHVLSFAGVGTTDVILWRAPGAGYTVTRVDAWWTTEASAGTLDVKKVASGTAIASGTSILTATIDLTGAANTVTNGALDSAQVLLTNGQLLGLDFTGVTGSPVGITVQFTIEVPGNATGVVVQMVFRKRRSGG